MCVFISLRMWFHPALTDVLHHRFAQWKNTPGRICGCNTQQLIYQGKLEQMQVIVLFRVWGLAKQDQMQRSWWLRPLAGGDPVAPKEALLAVQVPPCNP